jgi:DNA-binding response OmpR family regulator
MVLETPAAKAEKILIIDGNDGYADQVAEALKKDGYANVVLTKNSADGLKSLYDTLPHLVLLDISSPGLGGYEILNKKQNEPLLAKIPVFLVSTGGTPINMRNVPPGSVAEFVISLHAKPSDVLDKLNKRFGYPMTGQASQAPGGQVKKKLLWVEDDKLIGTILGKKLTSSGFDLFHALNGEQAINYLKNNKPDLVAVDLLLPGMSGFDILAAIKADSTLEKVPKMVLSNLSKTADIDKAKSLGANKFLVKASTSLDQIVAEIRDMAR